MKADFKHTANVHRRCKTARGELYNSQNQPFNLYEAHASLDNGSADIAFHFPFGSDIPAHGYLIVFPETYALSNSMLNGNTMRLTFSGTVIDLVSTPTLRPDTSYARIPDGSANWQITTNPTIDTRNQSSTQVPPTPTRVPTKTSSGSSNGSSGNGSSGSGNTTRKLVTGKQPDWGKLQLPAANASATPASNSPLVTSPAISPAVSAWDVPRRILLTVLVVALALSLFWCWKVFSSA